MVDGYGYLDADNNLSMTKEKKKEKKSTLEMTFHVSPQHLQRRRIYPS